MSQVRLKKRTNVLVTSDNSTRNSPITPLRISTVNVKEFIGIFFSQFALYVSFNFFFKKLHTYIHTYTHTYIHRYILTYIHAYPHIYDQVMVGKAKFDHKQWLFMNDKLPTTISNRYLSLLLYDSSISVGRCCCTNIMYYILKFFTFLTSIVHPRELPFHTHDCLKTSYILP